MMSRETPFQRYNEIEPQVGDLIQIKINGAECATHKEWVIYMGHGGVVHLEPMVDEWNTLLGKAKVRQSKMAEVVVDAERQLVRVNNREEDAKERGKTPLPLEDIIHNVIAQVWMNVDVPYDGKNRNCEYYATLWKYGEGWSSQNEIS